MKRNPCVLQDWLLKNCSWREQTVLVVSLRGPDGLPKKNHGKNLCRFMRSCILKDAMPNKGTFMGIEAKEAIEITQKFLDEHDEYPHHFIMHLAHAAEIVGYKHPDETIRKIWKTFYKECCKAFHMHPETEKEMDARLADEV